MKFQIKSREIFKENHKKSIFQASKFDQAEKEMFAYMDAVCEELGVAECVLF